jgi:hypothetical protein
LKKDIEFPENNQVLMAICPGETKEDLWDVILINYQDQSLKNILVSSSGIGINENNQKIETSTLRHFFDSIEGFQYQVIEKMDPEIFTLQNEFWVSFWIGEKLFDRNFIFVPGSIDVNHCVQIDLISKTGVLHA